MNTAQPNIRNILYWGTILSACMIGETVGDYFSFGLQLGYGWSAIILSCFLAIALIVEGKAKKQSEARYWLTIIIMSTSGTAFADFITRTLALGYGWGSALLIILFVTVFFAERLYLSRNKQIPQQIEKNISHGSLPQTNVFYWTSILIASTFGTTMGDFVSNGLELGFGGGSMLLMSLLIITLFLEFRSKAETILYYWIALVIASTIGATTGDYLTKPDALNLGYGIGSAILIALFTIIFFTRRHFNNTTVAAIA